MTDCMQIIDNFFDCPYNDHIQDFAYMIYKYKGVQHGIQT